MSKFGGEGLFGSKFPIPHAPPADFECQVLAKLDAMGHQVLEYRSEQQGVVQGLDGEYEIGFTVRFSAFGMDFLVII